MLSKVQEDAIVNEAFRLLETPIRGWIRARVRKGSSALESVASLSRLLHAGDSIVHATGGVVNAIGGVLRAVGDVRSASRGKRS